MLCNLQIFSGCVCHLEQLHAQSPFLFPIVFSINLIPFFDISSVLAVHSPGLFGYVLLYFTWATARSQELLFVVWLVMHFEHSTAAAGSERVDAYAYALGQRAVEVIICMITRDFSVISMTSQASLSLSLLLTKVTHAQYRKRFRASYNRTERAPQVQPVEQERTQRERKQRPTDPHTHPADRKGQ